MKNLLFLLCLLIVSQLLSAQEQPKTNNQQVRTNVDRMKAISVGENDTTSKLPPGVKFQNGKIAIKPGYKAVYSSDKKLLFIMSRKGLNITGSYYCDCRGEAGSCRTEVNDGMLFCGGAGCCKLIVTTQDLSGLTMQGIEEAPEKLTWKRIVMPVKVN